jgi:hypothetical protein
MKGVKPKVKLDIEEDEKVIFIAQHLRAVDWVNKSIKEGVDFQEVLKF